MELRQKAKVLMQYRSLRREAALLADHVMELDACGETARATALRERLRQRQAQCLEELQALYGFIYGVDDSLTRRILIHRYVDGKSWRGVARCIGERDEQYPRRLHNRFLAGAEVPGAEGRQSHG